MPDYDKIEQLHRMKANGALSADEFEKEKAKLLEGGPTASGTRINPLYLLLGFAVIAIVAIVTVLSGGSRSAVQTASDVPAVAVEGTADTATLPATTSPSPAATTAKPGPTLAWAFSPETVGLNPLFIESKLGPAKTKDDTDWTFDVQGCEVSYTVEKNMTTSVGAPITKTCHPVFEDKVLTENTTVGELQYDQVRTSCLSNCGNAYDPTIDLFRSGFHANNFIDVVYQTSGGEHQVAAAEMWTEAIRVAHGIAADDYNGEDLDWFQCVFGPPASAVAALRSENIGYVRIGANLHSEPNCLYK